MVSRKRCFPRSVNQEVRLDKSMERSIAVAPRWNSIGCETLPRPLLCCCRRMQKKRSMATGFVGAQRTVGGKDGAQFSYNVGISACEKCKQWQRAVALLSEMREAKLEPDVIYLQRGDQRVREGLAVAAGFGAVQGHAGGNLGAQLSYNAVTSACEKGGQWQQALALLSGLLAVKLEPDVISYSAVISTCEKGEQWQRALSLFSEMSETKLEPDVSVTALGSARARRASSGSGLCGCSARCRRRS
ncbi:unnamed protein product [Prorocentrum cordatum]|uniref:Pentatricopeptide repeat-containing protein, chloroplastic n=1 Tax=Prorocentrum cordatum TaxID=2364126 RepID=A0ABN9T919_9DINO|nr:unnamed protein product [Polarella glacialis]